MKLSFSTGIALVLAILLGVYALSSTARAIQTTSGDQVNIDQVVEDDLLTAGRSIRVRSEIKGDLAAAGREIRLMAPVEGSVMSAARNVTLSGPVGNDVWAAGETVDVEGRIANNAMIAGRTVHLHRDAAVGQDAQLAGETVTAEGRIERNLKIGAATASISADVGGTVNARATRVEILPGAVIRGDLIVRSPQPPNISPQAQVLGRVDYQRSDTGPGWFAWPWMWLYGFVALLVLGLASIAFSPTWAGRVTAMMKQRFGGSIVAGLLTLVVIPILAGVLFFTLVGIPLAVLLMSLYLAVLLLSGVFVSYRVGTWIFDRMHRPAASRWARLAVGALVVSLGVSLPFIGPLVACVVLILGAGALALERLAQRQQLRTA
jgi:hypothetical protein